jgi:signal transduction histidine kinase
MTGRESYFLLVTILVLVTVLLIFAMKYVSSARRVRAQSADEAAYRDLAERTLKAQEDLAAALASIRGSVTQIEGRLASVEKVLKDVG